MKILVLSREYFPIIGGGGRATRILAEEWVRQGHRVDLVTASIGDIPRKEIVNGVNVIRVNAFSRRASMTIGGAVGYTISALVKGAILLRQNRYDAIHSGFLVPAGFVGVVLSKLYHVPHETMPMGGDVYEPARKASPHRNFLFRAVVRWVVSNSIVATSSSDLEDKIKKYYSAGARQIRIPVGFLEPSGLDIVVKEPFLKEIKTIVAVGTLYKRKNYDKIIEAVARLHRLDIQLRIIGQNGPAREQLELLIKEGELADRVFLLGALSEKEKYEELLRADLFCSMADQDGYSIVCQEGMYFGLPIIAANTGGQIDYLINEKNALLVDAQNSDSIAQAIERLLEDRNLAKKIAQQAKHDSEQFASDKVARQHIAVLSGSVS